MLSFCVCLLFDIGTVLKQPFGQDQRVLRWRRGAVLLVSKLFKSFILSTVAVRAPVGCIWVSTTLSLSLSPLSAWSASPQWPVMSPWFPPTHLTHHMPHGTYLSDHLSLYVYLYVSVYTYTSRGAWEGMSLWVISTARATWWARTPVWCSVCCLACGPLCCRSSGRGNKRLNGPDNSDSPDNPDNRDDPNNPDNFNPKGICSFMGHEQDGQIWY